VSGFYQLVQVYHLTTKLQRASFLSCDHACYVYFPQVSTFLLYFPRSSRFYSVSLHGCIEPFTLLPSSAHYWLLAGLMSAVSLYGPWNSFLRLKDSGSVRDANWFLWTCTAGWAVRYPSTLLCLLRRRSYSCTDGLWLRPWRYSTYGLISSSATFVHLVRLREASQEVACSTS
jgi:hypothetical protein